MIERIVEWFDPQFARRRNKGHFSLMSYIQYKWTHRKVNPISSNSLWLRRMERKYNVHIVDLSK